MILRIMVGALALTIAAIQPGVAQELKGDAEAVAAIDRMIDRLGGKAVWSGARSLYLEYHGWRTEPNEPVVERALRDLARSDRVRSP